MEDKIKLYNGDCLEIMKEIPDNSISLITIDPPYGINYKSGWSNKFDKIKGDDNLEFLPKLFHQLNRISKNDSHLYCFVPVQEIGQFHNEIKKYWEINNIITIPRAVKGGTGSLNSTFASQNEFCLFATKGKRLFEETKILKPKESYIKDKRRKPKEWIYRLPDYWSWAKVSEHNLKRLHPTQKTVEVFDIMIQVSSKEEEVVLDCFMGSGSSGVSAVKNNRKFIGIELDNNYFNIAQDRINKVLEQESA